MSIIRKITPEILESSTAVALIEAGIDQFGLYGQKATTRMVAEQANANIAAIPYYFRNKNGLYSACMDYIVDEIWIELGETFEELNSACISMTPDDSKEAFLGIMESFCNFFLRNPDTLRWSQFIMREHATPTEAYEIFFTRYYKHVQRIKNQLLANCLGADPEDRRVKIQTHAMFGQVLGFLIARESILRSLKVKTVDDDLADEVQKIIRQNLETLIAQPF